MRARVTPSLLIAVLGVAQIVSWGSLYYSFSLFVRPMQQSFGWSLSEINGALTCGLLTAGVCAFPVGALIDRGHARLVMTIGSLVAALLLIAWSQVQTITAFYLIWVGVGACMAAVLYEPVFVVLTYYFGADARPAITRLTLIAGFASTVFMPLIEYLLATLKWRDVLLVLATIVACTTVPLHALFVPVFERRSAPGADPIASRADGLLPTRHLTDPVFWGLTLCFTAYAGTMTGLMFQFVPMMKALEVDTSTIFVAIALIGPSQVAGRMALMFCGDRASLVVVGGFVTLMMPLAVSLLVALPATSTTLIAFAMCFGVANGVSTILRGTAPAAWLGRQAFGKTMGAMGAPIMLVSALAPSATAAIWSYTGDPQMVPRCALLFAVAGSVSFWLTCLVRAKRVASEQAR